MADQTEAQRSAQLSRPGELFKDAPAGADQLLDDLFPNPDQQPQTAEQAPVVQATQTPTTTTDEPFLQVATGTLYKSKEEAIRCYEEKDRYIAKLRQELQDAQGKIPTAQSAASTPDPSESLYDELANAAEKRDKKGYVAAQA